MGGCSGQAEPLLAGSELAIVPVTYLSACHAHSLFPSRIGTFQIFRLRPCVVFPSSCLKTSPSRGMLEIVDWLGVSNNMADFWIRRLKREGCRAWRRAWLILEAYNRYVRACVRKNLCCTFAHLHIFPLFVFLLVSSPFLT